MKLSEYLQTQLVSQAIFGRQVGVTQSAVAQWVAGGTIKAEKVLDVCAATQWNCRPHDLRPDLYPNPGDGMPKAAA